MKFLRDIEQMVFVVRNNLSSIRVLRKLMLSSRTALSRWLCWVDGTVGEVDSVTWLC